MSTSGEFQAARRGWSFRWDKLRPLGNSLAAHATIAVPLIGYFILFNDYIIDTLKLNTSICDRHPCDVSWRLKFLYFGGSLYGLATAIYAVFCPSEIKKFADAAEYLVRHSAFFANRYNLEYLANRIQRMGGSVPDDIADRMKRGEPSYTTTQLGNIMAEHYIVLNTSHYLARLTSGIGFAAGILLVLVPTVVTFAQVLWIAIGS